MIFKAFWIEELPGGGVRRSVIERPVDDLPPGDLLVDVHYSSLNYKDALSASGNKGVTRKYPHTPGIDAAGVVRDVAGGAGNRGAVGYAERSKATLAAPQGFKPGDAVIVMGHDLGMNTPGGLAACIRVPAEWAIPLPAGLSLRDAMIIGTAGFTAAQSLYALMERQGLRPHERAEDNAAAVTGASGGVGCVAVALLARAGFEVTAITGKMDEAAWLTKLGARTVMPRAEFMSDAARPLLRGRWIAGVDTVGGEPLSVLLRSLAYRGAATTCGSVAGADLQVSVFPFLLRGVTLYGIDSAACPMPQRLEIWKRLAGAWKLENLEDFVTEIPLGDVNEHIEAMLAGKSRGRVVVRIEFL